MDTHDRITAILSERKISKRKLAQMADIPSSTLISALSGKEKRLSSDMVQKIANALGTSVAVLTGEQTQEDFERQISNIFLSQNPELENSLSFANAGINDISGKYRINKGLKITDKNPLSDDMKQKLADYITSFGCMIDNASELTTGGNIEKKYVEFLNSAEDSVSIINSLKEELITFAIENTKSPSDKETLQDLTTRKNQK